MVRSVSPRRYAAKRNKYHIEANDLTNFKVAIHSRNALQAFSDAPIGWQSCCVGRIEICQSGVPAAEAMQTGRSDRCPDYSYKTHFASRLAAFPSFAYSRCLAQPIFLSTFGFIHRLVPQSALPFAHTGCFGRRSTPSHIFIAALSQSFKH